MQPMTPKGTSLRVPSTCRPGNERKATRGFSDSVEEYVEGIYRLQTEADLVSTGEVAAYMCVSAGSSTTMIKKLAEMGLAFHEPYQGIRLSPSGERLAKRLIRAHRLLEVFLMRTLDLSWAEVHELACKLEHYVTDDLVDRIDEKMGSPRVCPHGSPIDMDIPDGSFRLNEAMSGAKLKVVKVTDERVEFLHHLEAIGLTLGAEFEIESDSPIDSLLHLRMGNESVTVGPEVCRHVWVVSE
jgi:DtxR family transcriptional regulator, Mn-dependent transcriptional regulator